MRMDTEQPANNRLAIILMIAFFLAIAVPSILKMSSGMGQVGIQIPTSQIAMPEPPRCDGELCQWEAEGELDENGCVNWIRVLLKRNGCAVAENQMVKIQTQEYQQTASLAEQGYEEAWVSQVEVNSNVQGKGLGRAAWKGGDAVIRNISGSNPPVSIFADMVGWGEKLIADIETELILISEEGFWAYLVG